MKPRLLLALFALLPAFAFAVPATIEWNLPTEDCGGNPIVAADILEMEIFIATSPIPSSGLPCPDAGGTVDAPPADFTQRVDAGDQAGSVTVELDAGNTYHVRARVRTADGWSNLSNEVTEVIPAEPSAPSAPSAPVIIRLGI